MEGENQAAPEGAVKALNSMNNLCSSTVCRHRALVEYFGQTYARASCEACDVCLDELELAEDPLTISQKILSCVVRLEERFGAAHTAKVLIGSTEPRILEFKHDKLSTYGLMASEGLAAVRMWIDQLISQGYLQRSGEYQVLSLTESGRRLIKRDGNPRLTVAAQPTTRKRSTSSAEPSWEGVDRGLFDALRKLRSELALARSVPAYVIFGDEPLRDFARFRPTTVATFATIRGVGEQKKQDFANTFVTAISEYCAQNQLSTDLDTSVKPAPVETVVAVRKSNSFAAFDYFRRGESLDVVAKKLDRAYSTICTYLEDYLRHEKVIDCTPWVDADTREQIIAVAHLVENRRVKPLFEHFKAKISYETLRIVMICHENAKEI